MKRREGPQVEGALSAGGGGGGRMKPMSSYDKATAGQARAVQRSIEEAGGYPSRNAKPMMTKMQQRREQMRSDYEATQEQGLAERDARRLERKSRLLGFKKGGMCREYGK